MNLFWSSHLFSAPLIDTLTFPAFCLRTMARDPKTDLQGKKVSLTSAMGHFPVGTY